MKLLVRAYMSPHMGSLLHRSDVNGLSAWLVFPQLIQVSNAVHFQEFAVRKEIDSDRKTYKFSLNSSKFSSIDSKSAQDAIGVWGKMNSSADFIGKARTFE